MDYHRCEKLAQSFYAIKPGLDSNPRPLDRESDALPQHHDATYTRTTYTRNTVSEENLIYIGLVQNMRGKSLNLNQLVCNRNKVV